MCDTITCNPQAFLLQHVNTSQLCNSLLLWMLYNNYIPLFNEPSRDGFITTSVLKFLTVNLLVSYVSDPCSVLELGDKNQELFT